MHPQLASAVGPRRPARPLAEALLLHSGAITAAGVMSATARISDQPAGDQDPAFAAGSLMHAAHGGVPRIDPAPGLPGLQAGLAGAGGGVETLAIVISAAANADPAAAHDEVRRAAAARPPDHRQQDRRQGADLSALLSGIPTTFGKECLPLNLPDAGATRVADCFYNRAGHSDFGAVADAHRALVEQVVEVDGAFVDRYLNDGDDGCQQAARRWSRRCAEVIDPVCFVSARTGAGVAGCWT